jgi:predicted nucleic-acid-binding Zn-ribbon protein
VRIRCLRCENELTEYYFTPMSLHPNDAAKAHVVLECKRCGHVELLSKTSPLLKDLKGVPSYSGDGD